MGAGDISEVDAVSGATYSSKAIIEAVQDGRKAVLSCSYAVKWFSKHPEYADVLEDPEAEAKRAEQMGGPACGLRR